MSALLRDLRSYQASGHQPDISRTLQERPTIPFCFVGLDFWETCEEYLQGNRYVFGAICYATSVVYTFFLQSRKPGPDCLK